MAQQHHHDSLSQHTAQYSCSNDETQRHDPEPKHNWCRACPQQQIRALCYSLCCSRHLHKVDNGHNLLARGAPIVSHCSDGEGHSACTCYDAAQPAVLVSSTTRMANTWNNHEFSLKNIHIKLLNGSKLRHTTVHPQQAVDVMPQRGRRRTSALCCQEVNLLLHPVNTGEQDNECMHCASMRIQQQKPTYRTGASYYIP